MPITAIEPGTEFSVEYIMGTGKREPRTMKVIKLESPTRVWVKMERRKKPFMVSMSYAQEAIQRDQRVKEIQAKVKPITTEETPKPKRTRTRKAKATDAPEPRVRKARSTKASD